MEITSDVREMGKHWDGERSEKLTTIVNEIAK